MEAQSAEDELADMNREALEAELAAEELEICMADLGDQAEAAVAEAIAPADSEAADEMTLGTTMHALRERWERLPEAVQSKLAEAGLSCDKPQVIAGLADGDQEAQLFAEQLLGGGAPASETLVSDLTAVVLVAQGVMQKRTYHRVTTSLERRLAVLRAERELRAPVQRMTAARQAALFSGVRKHITKPAKWNTRRRQLLAGTLEVGLTRAQVETKERDRWIARLVEVLCDGNFPVCAKAGRQPDPVKILRHMGGGSSARTIRQHVRHWIRLARFAKLAAPEIERPTEDVVIQYTEALFEEPCKRTVPGSLLAAMSYVEEAGGVAAGERLAKLPTIVRMVESMTRQLSVDAPKTRKAATIPLCLMMALEIFVVNTAKPRFARGFAWLQGVCLWASLRSDDLQGASPTEVQLTKAGLTGVLERTKVSGPGKRLRFVPFHVDREAWLIESSWLEVGFQLWQESGMYTTRDYLLPLPTADLDGVIDRKAEYTDMAAMCRKLFSELEVPDYDHKQRRWRNNGEALLLPELVDLWTLHSARNLLTNHCAELGFTKPELDHLGRWGAGQSNEYLKSARAIVARMQGAVAVAARAEPTQLSDEAALLEVRAFLQKRELEEERIKEQLRVLNFEQYLPQGRETLQVDPNFVTYRKSACKL